MTKNVIRDFLLREIVGLSRAFCNIHLEFLFPSTENKFIHPSAYIEGRALPADKKNPDTSGQLNFI